MPNGRSPLAVFATNPRIGKKMPSVYGVCVHTTGSTIVEKAMKLNTTPIKLILAYYLSPGANFPHYVIDIDGKVTQVCMDDEVAWHVGDDPLMRLKYLDGSWETLAPALVLVDWKKRWPQFKSPQHMYPTQFPNQSYIGVELIPINTNQYPGPTYSDLQYEALAKLIKDIKLRHSLPDAILQTGSSRLVGHEDLSITRWEPTHCWDPQGFGKNIKFDWAKLYSRF